MSEDVFMPVQTGDPALYERTFWSTQRKDSLYRCLFRWYSRDYKHGDQTTNHQETQLNVQSKCSVRNDLLSPSIVQARLQVPNEYSLQGQHGLSLLWCKTSNPNFISVGATTQSLINWTAMTKSLDDTCALQETHPERQEAAIWRSTLCLP